MGWGGHMGRGNSALEGCEKNTQPSAAAIQINFKAELEEILVAMSPRSSSKLKKNKYTELERQKK